MICNHCGAVQAHTPHIVKVEFAPNQIFGMLHIDGEEIPCYIGNEEAHPLNIGGKVVIKRKFTFIER